MVTRSIAPLLAVLMIATVSFAEDKTGGAKEAAGKDDKTMAPATAQSIHEFKVRDIEGNEVCLDKYKGKVCLVVNVASKCGLTPQYKELEAMHRKYKDQGLCVLGFPANNFMGQEPGTNVEIRQFCSSKYDVTFDLFAKVSVKGDDQCPLYQYLTGHPDENIAGEVQWNFQKYLVGRDGTVIAKFSPRTGPDDKKLVAALETALKAPAPEEPDKDAD